MVSLGLVISAAVEMLLEATLYWQCLEVPISIVRNRLGETLLNQRFDSVQCRDDPRLLSTPVHRKNRHF